MISGVIQCLGQLLLQERFGRRMFQIGFQEIFPPSEHTAPFVRVKGRINKEDMGRSSTAYESPYRLPNHDKLVPEQLLIEILFQSLQPEGAVTQSAHPFGIGLPAQFAHPLACLEAKAIR